MKRIYKITTLGTLVSAPILATVACSDEIKNNNEGQGEINNISSNLYKYIDNKEFDAFKNDLTSYTSQLSNGVEVAGNTFMKGHIAINEKSVLATNDVLKSNGNHWEKIKYDYNDLDNIFLSLNDFLDNITNNSHFQKMFNSNSTISSMVQPIIKLLVSSAKEISNLSRNQLLPEKAMKKYKYVKLIDAIKSLDENSDNTRYIKSVISDFTKKSNDPTLLTDKGKVLRAIKRSKVMQTLNDFQLSILKLDNIHLENSQEPQYQDTLSVIIQDVPGMASDYKKIIHVSGFDLVPEKKLEINQAIQNLESSDFSSIISSTKNSNDLTLNKNNILNTILSSNKFSTLSIAQKALLTVQNIEINASTPSSLKITINFDDQIKVITLNGFSSQIMKHPSLVYVINLLNSNDFNQFIDYSKANNVSINSNNVLDIIREIDKIKTLSDNDKSLLTTKNIQLDDSIPGQLELTITFENVIKKIQFNNFSNPLSKLHKSTLNKTSMKTKLSSFLNLEINDNSLLSNNFFKKIVFNLLKNNDIKDIYNLKNNHSLFDLEVNMNDLWNEFQSNIDSLISLSGNLYSLYNSSSFDKDGSFSKIINNTSLVEDLVKILNSNHINIDSPWKNNQSQIDSVLKDIFSTDAFHKFYVPLQNALLQTLVKFTQGYVSMLMSISRTSATIFGTDVHILVEAVLSDSSDIISIDNIYSPQSLGINSDKFDTIDLSSLIGNSPIIGDLLTVDNFLNEEKLQSILGLILPSLIHPSIKTNRPQINEYVSSKGNPILNIFINNLKNAFAVQVRNSFSDAGIVFLKNKEHTLKYFQEPIKLTKILVNNIFDKNILKPIYDSLGLSGIIGSFLPTIIDKAKESITAFITNINYSIADNTLDFYRENLEATINDRKKEEMLRWLKNMDTQTYGSTTTTFQCQVINKLINNNDFNKITTYDLSNDMTLTKIDLTYTQFAKTYKNNIDYSAPTKTPDLTSMFGGLDIVKTLINEDLLKLAGLVGLASSHPEQSLSKQLNSQKVLEYDSKGNQLSSQDLSIFSDIRKRLLKYNIDLTKPVHLENDPDQLLSILKEFVDSNLSDIDSPAEYTQDSKNHLSKIVYSYLPILKGPIENLINNLNQFQSLFKLDFTNFISTFFGREMSMYVLTNNLDNKIVKIDLPQFTGFNYDSRIDKPLSLYGLITPTITDGHKNKSKVEELIDNFVFLVPQFTGLANKIKTILPIVVKILGY